MEMLPEELKHVAVSVSFYTFRGILYTRFTGTILDSIILPITSSKDILRLAKNTEADIEGVDTENAKAE